MLVGTKTDLRSDKKILEQLESENKAPITKEQGEAKAKEIGAIAYAECSLLKNEGVKEVFDKAVASYIEAISKDGNTCIFNSSYFVKSKQKEICSFL